MSWILLVTGAYLLLAVANVSDKVFLKTLFRHPASLASIVGGLGIVSLALAPFGEFTWPGWFLFSTSMVAGACFIFALLFFFHALSAEEASRVIPYVGALIPLLTLLLSSAVLEEQLSTQALFGFFLLIAGGYVVAHDPWSHPKEHSYRTWIMASLAALMFAVSFVFSKWLFGHMEFISAFIWVRLGSFITALAFVVVAVLLHHRYVREFANIGTKGFLAFVGVQLIGGIGFILQNVAISRGSVSLVNAMQGIQYVFVIVLAGVLAKKFPNLIREKISGKVIAAKLAGVVIIGAGLVLIA